MTFEEWWKEREHHLPQGSYSGAKEGWEAGFLAGLEFQKDRIKEMQITNSNLRRLRKKHDI